MMGPPEQQSVGRARTDARPAAASGTAAAGKREAGGSIDALFAAKKARASPTPKLQLRVELHPNNFVFVSGDTQPLRDYLLKPLGFEWCRAIGKWQNKTGGRPAFDRLLARIDRAHTDVDAQDHAPPLAKCALLSESSGLDDLSESCAHPARAPDAPRAAPRAAPPPTAPAWTEDEMLPDDVLCAALDVATGAGAQSQPTPASSQSSAGAGGASAPTASAPTVPVAPAAEDSDALTDAAMCAALDEFERSRAGCS